MGDHTLISWSEATWNPLVGCEYASPGCARCYAAGLAAGRLAHLPAYAGLAVRPADGSPPRFTGEVRLLPDRLDQPRRWRRPRLVFVNSMSDLFHPAVDDAFVTDVFDVIRDTPRHTYQLLTKRPQRMAAFTRRYYDCDHGGAPTSSCSWCAPFMHMWLGASIETNRYAFRANHVRATHAAVRWLSLEPLLGPLPDLDLTDIDWVVIGAESGRGATPMDLGWARDVRDRCVDAGVPVFIKQLTAPGARGVTDDIDKFPEDLRVRDWPTLRSGAPRRDPSRSAGGDRSRSMSSRSRPPATRATRAPPPPQTSSDPPSSRPRTQPDDDAHTEKATAPGPNPGSCRTDPSLPERVGRPDGTSPSRGVSTTR